MIRLSRKSEYALLALAYLHANGTARAASAKDIAAHYRLPSALLAKVLQTLKHRGILSSAKGVSGGYRIERDLRGVSLHELLGCFEEDTALVECLGHEPSGPCEQLDCCAIRDPIAALNDAIQDQLRRLSLAALFDTPPRGARVSVGRLRRELRPPLSVTTPPVAYEA